MIGESAPLDVASYFSDPDGDALTYAATSSNTGVATVSLSGTLVTITGVAAGTATVTVTASDPGGLSASLSAAVTVEEVNQAPLALLESDSLAAYAGEKLAGDAAEFFVDPDGDQLTFSAASSDQEVVAVSTVSSFVGIVAVQEGSATVTLTATDPHGLSASIVWTFSVESAEEPAYPHGCMQGSEQSLAMGDSVSGTASWLPESDCFAIEVGAGQVGELFRLTAYTEGDSDTNGALLDSNYDPIDINQDGGADSNFQVVGMVKAGRYIVEVHGEFGETGEYLLKADDHGDSPATATPVADSARGSFANTGNVDFFQIGVRAAGVLEVSTTGGMDTHGTLYDESGDLLATNDDGGHDGNFLIRHETRPGDYYVRVEGSTSGSYGFHVRGVEVRTGPDLAFSGVRPSEVIMRRSGPRVEMYFALENVGDTRSEAPTARVFVSSDSAITTSDIELEEIFLDPGLWAGETLEFNFGLEIGANTALGTVYFGACVDAVAQESNTYNNCSSSVKATIVDASAQTGADVSSRDPRLIRAAG